MNIAPEIFKAYDIRGIVGTSLTEETARLIGQALGSEARAAGLTTIAIGRDGRLSGPALAAALADGIISTGTDAVDIGCVPTPVTYFAAHHLGTQSCVSVTGSHNPPDYNGFKIVLGGETLHGERIQALRYRIASADFISPPRSPHTTDARLAAPHGGAGVGLGRPGADFAMSKGVLRRTDVRPAYLDRIVKDVKLARPLKIVVDCGNGVAGELAPELFRRLGCEVIELFCEIDGNFPNHHPDPSKPENLRDVQRVLRETDAELGLAFDGDGDRLGVVTKDGEIIYPDRQLMLFAADILTRNPGALILYDVKCSRWVAESVRRQGGVPLMWNTGHALIKAKLKETGAPLAGEMSGHMFFNERWYGFDDGLYAGARLLEIVSRWPDANWPLKNLPNALSTPELNLKMREGEPHQLIARLKDAAQAGRIFRDARELVLIDGVRAEYADGFGLARPSNTTPVIVLRFEADNENALERIQNDFKTALESVWPGLDVHYSHGH